MILFLFSKFILVFSNLSSKLFTVLPMYTLFVVLLTILYIFPF